jgi:two-component system chemotaxis response regulator CheB
MLMNKIRVLVVDDSAFMRKAIVRMLSTAQDIEVVDTAADGREAIAKTIDLRPDLITLDVKMTGMDGIAALERIMHDCPTPVIMLSSLTHEGAEVTLRALELGAVDFIDKSRADSAMDISLLVSELVAKVRAIAVVDIGKKRSALAGIIAPPAAFRTTSGMQSSDQIRASERVDIVVIGTSTGGPPALNSLIPRFPRNFRAGVIIVQHMPAGFTRPFAERLNMLSLIPITEAADGDQMMPGRGLVAPAGKHLKLHKKNGVYLVMLDSSPSDTPHKPSVDVTMASVAEVCGSKSLGVLLTGMGSDGAKGMRAIKDAGGTTLAESEETCIVYGMPKSAVEAGAVDKIVPLYHMAHEIVTVVS